MPKAIIRIRARPDGSDMDCNMHLKDESGETAAELRIHGGRIDTAALLYPSAPQPWIDLSTGINPIAWPVPQMPLARYQRLPLAREMAQMTAAAARDAGAEVHELVALPDPKAHDFETLIVVNPNNPDGRAIARANLAAFAQAWTAAGRRLIVDEAFADVRTDVSLLAMPELPVGVVVLRSLGKFFGLAGLRVGFVVVREPDASA